MRPQWRCMPLVDAGEVHVCVHVLAQCPEGSTAHCLEGSAARPEGSVQRAALRVVQRAALGLAGLYRKPWFLWIS